jgi:hypothetical protein
MWVSLTDSKLVDIYKQGFLPEEIPQDIFLLLEQLSKKSYAKKLSAVTSIGQLYLTTALSWEDTERNDIVRIGQRIDAGKTVITMSYHRNGFNKSVADHQCSLEEAIDYIDLYVMRLYEEKYGEL